jgi:hypothetical protein
MAGVAVISTWSPADAPPPSLGDEPAAAHAAVRTSHHVPVLVRLSN